MKLSTFDLSWYSQWPIRHTSLDEWSRPGLTNGLGSVQTGGDPTSIRHVIFPPVSGAEEFTAFLTLNGTFLAATRLETDTRWCPWAIDREAVYDHWKIETRMTLPPGEHAVVQRIRITNTAETARSLRLGLRLSGRCVNRGIQSWYWGVPGVATTLAGLLESTGLDPVVTRLEDGVLTRERAPENSDSEAGKAFNAQVLSPAPHSRERNGDACWRYDEIRAGESVTLTLVLALGETAEEALIPARKLLGDPERAFADAEAHWRQLWRSAFTEDGPLSGRVNDLDLSEDLAPVAVSSLLSLLQARRTHRVTQGKAFYNISTPRRVEACYYPNDWSMATPALAQLDPEATWRQLEMALTADVRKYNQINFLTGRGGDAAGPGWPYTVDIYNAFNAAWQLWSAEFGVRSAEALGRRMKTAAGEMTLLEVFEDLAFDWRSRKVADLNLADYGSKHELLECVSTYEHVVAGLNACAVWMLRRLAELSTVCWRAPKTRRKLMRRRTASGTRFWNISTSTAAAGSAVCCPTVAPAKCATAGTSPWCSNVWVGNCRSKFRRKSWAFSKPNCKPPPGSGHCRRTTATRRSADCAPTISLTVLSAPGRPKPRSVC